MKAEIVNGKLVLMPESKTEVYAVKCWLESQCIHFDDPLRIESRYIRGSSIGCDESLSVFSK
jgi:hypothetical protein